MRIRGGGAQLLWSERGTAATGTSAALALLAGFVASVAMVFAFAIAFILALVLASLPIIGQWFHGLTNNALIDVAGPNLYAATAVFFIGGLIWALLYGLVFEPRLSGSAWQKGVRFALVPWLFSLIVFMPLVGGGFLGFGLGAGPMPILGNLILHVVYGAVLGVVWGSADSIIDRPLHRPAGDDLQAGRVSELGAARGLVIGVGLGIVVGVLGALLVPQGGQGLGMNPLGMIVAIALTGAAFGGFVGSLSATPPTET